MPEHPRRRRSAIQRPDPSHGRGRRRRLCLAAAVCAFAVVAAVLIAYRPSLAPPALHPRAVEFAAAKAEVLLDTPVSQLVDRTQDPYLELTPNTAVSDALLLRTQGASQLAADAAGIPGQEVSVAGPFTLLLNRTEVASRGPSLLGTPRVNPNYRFLVDVDGARPMISLYAQAPTTRAAFAIVDSMRTLLIQSVNGPRAAGAVPAAFRAIIRPLGPTTGGVVDPGASLQLMAFVFCLVLGLGGTLALAVERRLARGPRQPSAGGLDQIGVEAAPAGDDWPHTKRLLPWGLAVFMAMVFLVPIDAMTLPLHLPVSSNPDRALLIVIGAFWILALILARGAARPRLRFTRIHFAVLAFLGVCFLSVALNGHELAVYQEVSPTLKKLLLLVSFVAFFVIAASVIRAREVPRFIVLMVSLGVIVAIAAIVESKTRYNVFYSAWQKVLPVNLPNEIDKLDHIGRLTVDGPTSEPLELAALLAMVIPFAVIGAITAVTRKRQLIYVLASTILLAGAIATQRKTSIVAVGFGILILVAYRPRLVIRGLLVASVPLFLAVHFIAPGQIGSLLTQLLPGHANTVLTTTDRVVRYDAVRPDVLSHFLLGRGFQSYDPLKYRILDNEYLGLLIGVGVIGLVAYLAIFGGLLRIAHRTIRGRDPARAAAALPALAAIVIVIVSNALFDVLSFPHVSYLFFFIGAMLLAPRERSLGDPPPVARGSGESEVEHLFVPRAPRVEVDELEPLLL